METTGAVPAGATRHTTFTVAMSDPASHLYEIEMAVAPFGAPVSSFDLVMPVWAPGSYAVRDFARNVRDLVVSDADGVPLPVRKVEKSRWRVAVPGTGSAGPFVVRYRVYAHELTVRTSHLDASHGYGNGTSLFLYVDGRKDEPQRLAFRCPERWRVSISLPERGGLYEASDYDELVDAPFECGTHRTWELEVRGVPHTLAIWGSGNEEPERLVRDVGRIVEAAAALFGSLPYERYLFILHVAAGASGGLEHRASQSCGVAPWRFRPEKSYREVLSLLSHELFHAWNVKRIRPGALGPFDYTREVHTRDLWAMEGVTSYYEGLQLARAGLCTPKQLFAEWAKTIKAHRDTPGIRVQSAEEASFDAWIRLYRPDENSPNVSESYYRRGELIALALDLTIRHESHGTGSLDEVLRRLWERWGSRGVGYPDGAWEAVSAEVAGRSLSGFFDLYVRGTGTPDLEALLPVVGLGLFEKAEKDEEAENGDGPSAPDAVPVRADLGWKTKGEKDRLVVAEVYEGRPASRCGVSAGDELVAADGFRVDDELLKRLERDRLPGSALRLHLFRRGRLVELPLVLGERRAFTYEIRVDPAAPPEARSLFAAWLWRPFPEEGKVAAAPASAGASPGPA